MFRDAVKSWIKHTDFMLIDIACLELGFLIAYVLRHGFPESGIPELYHVLMGLIIIVDIGVVFMCDSYSDIIYRSCLTELKQVMSHCAWEVILVIICFFFSKQSGGYSRIVVLLMYPVSVCIMFMARILWKRAVRIRRRHQEDYRRIMVVTTQSRAEEVIRGLLQPYRDYLVESIVLYDCADRIGEKICHIPVVADKDNMFTYIRENVIDEVFIDLWDNEKEARSLMNLCVETGLVAHMNLLRFDAEMKNRRVYALGQYMVLSTGMKIASFQQLFLKRAMDICGGLVGLALTGIAFVVFAPIIYYQSPGPIFFSQERVARNGRIFKIYKFRTMYMDAEERKAELMKYNKMKGFMFKMDNDPRVIPIGRFLRKSSIDELPQFWNILKGDMSLVGTRPPTVDEYRQYEPAHRKRLAMKPGLTGAWQVSGRNDIADFEEVVALDAGYIENWTLGMDVAILWKTIKVVALGKGAV